MSAKIATLLLATAATCLGATPATINPATLRRLVVLPAVDVTVGFTFSDRGFALMSFGSPAPENFPSEITALRQQMRGDASDAERYVRLGELYDDADDETNGCRAYAQAVELYRPQADAQPANGPLLTQFGTALWLAEQDARVSSADAEQLLRKAVTVAPRDWECWAGLGDFLEGQAGKALWSAAPDVAFHFQTADDYQKFANTLLQHPPPAAQMQRFEQCSQDALQCFARAVACAPADPAVYRRRMDFDYWRAFYATLVKALHDHSNPGLWLFPGGIFSPEWLADLKQVARLSPTNYQAIGLASLMELTHQTSLEANTNSQGNSHLKLTGESRQFFWWATARLDRLSRDPDARLAAGAAETLGILDVLTGRRSMIAAFRRAVTLDPSRDQAWELLTA